MEVGVHFFIYQSALVPELTLPGDCPHKEIYNPHVLHFLF